MGSRRRGVNGSWRDLGGDTLWLLTRCRVDVGVSKGSQMERRSKADQLGTGRAISPDFQMPTISAGPRAGEGDGCRGAGRREVRLEGLCLSGNRVIKEAEEGCSGSQCGQSETVTSPLGLPRPFPRPPLRAVGTELGLDRTRHSDYSEYSESLVTAGQGYRGDHGGVRRKGSGERRHFRRRQQRV